LPRGEGLRTTPVLGVGPEGPPAPRALSGWEVPARLPDEMALKQLQLFVRGRVQGVYFRASAQREARRLGLTGWVRNRSDGSVEIVAEGEEVAIRELHGWAQKGPSAARVERVDTRWRSFTGDFPDFRILD
jgi:acylphosphatase